jgi:hypothetical protein
MAAVFILAYRLQHEFRFGKMKFKPLKITKKKGTRKLVAKHPASRKAESSRNRKVSAPPEKMSTAEGRK